MPIDFVDVMKNKVHQALYSDEVMDFNAQFDKMQHLPLRYYMPPDVPYKIEKLATSLKYSDRIKDKKNEIRNILYPYGFRKYGTGTNRLTFQHVEDHSFLIKVAFDRVGMDNNPAEARNSYLLKPFMPKVFDVSNNGAISLTERVQPVTCAAEARSIAPDIFDLIIYHIIGKYVAADIGTKFYMNWGVRYGFGPVILDLTDLFELDGKKLHCNWLLPNGSHCGGEIDYDEGFNNLICNKCGHVYEARELAKKIEAQDPIIIKGGTNKMAIRVYEGDKELYSSPAMTENILPRAGRSRRPKINKIDRAKPMSIRIVVGDEEIKNTPHTETAKKTEKPAMKIRIEGVEPEHPKSATVKDEELREKATIDVSPSPTPISDQLEAIKNIHATIPEGIISNDLLGDLHNAVNTLEKLAGNLQSNVTEKEEVKVDSGEQLIPESLEDVIDPPPEEDTVSDGDSNDPCPDNPSIDNEAEDIDVAESTDSDEDSGDDETDTQNNEVPENDSAAEYEALQKDEDFINAMKQMSMVDGGKV